MNPSEELRAALQKFLDTFGDGWQVLSMCRGCGLRGSSPRM